VNVVTYEPPVVRLTVTIPRRSVKGLIHRVGHEFGVIVDADQLGTPTDLESSLRRLSEGVRAQVPAVDTDEWGLDLECHGPHRFGVAFGELGQVTWLGEKSTPCVERVLADVPSHTLSEAIEAAVEIVKDCCAASKKGRAWETQEATG
jgi:hypothetical protein